MLDISINNSVKNKLAFNNKYKYWATLKKQSIESETMKHYIADNENLYDKSFKLEINGQEYEETPDDYLERIRAKEIQGYAVEIYKTGPWAEVKLFPIWKKRSFVPHTGGKTPDAQAALNKKNAVNRLTRILNCNFRPYEDKFCTFTCDNAHIYETEEECYEAVEKAVKRIKYRFKKRGVQLKAVYKIEIKRAKDRFGRFIKNSSGNIMLRPHLHIVLNKGVPDDEIFKAWGLGWQKRNETLYYCKEGFVKLARYLVKDTKNGRRSWNSTLNLVKPPPPQKSFTHKAGTKKKVFSAAANENLRKEYFESILPGYIFVQADFTYNENTNGVYLHSRLEKENSCGNFNKK